jgi:hypothetical protein
MVDIDGRRSVHAGAEANARVAALFRDSLDVVSRLRGVTAAARIARRSFQTRDAG